MDTARIQNCNFVLDKCAILSIKRDKMIEDRLQLMNGNGISQLATEEKNNNEDRYKILIHYMSEWNN